MFSLDNKYFLIPCQQKSYGKVVVQMKSINIRNLFQGKIPIVSKAGFYHKFIKSMKGIRNKLRTMDKVHILIKGLSYLL